MDMAANAAVNVLCLQETKLTTEGLHAMRQAFHAKGWRLLPGPLDYDSEGKACGGVAIVSDWPVEMVTVPVAESFNTRVMAVKAHRPNQRPLLVICGYLPANDDELNQHIASTVLQWASTTGEDFVFMADWNRTPNQQPFCNFWRGTHRRADGTYTGRLLDFGLSSAGLAVDGRAQLLGPADHDLVTYDVGLQSGRRGWRWQPQRALDANATVDWDSCWAPHDERFWAFLGNADTDSAWPVKAEAHRGRVPDVQTLCERKLRRAARKAHEAIRQPGNLELYRNLVNYVRHVVDVYPDFAEALNLHGEALLLYLQQAAEAEARRANEARLDKWREAVKTDVPRLSRWIKASQVEAPSNFEDFGVDPDPQARAEHATVEWKKRWHRDARPDGQALQQLLNDLDFPEARPAQAPTVNGSALLRLAKAAARKAAGLDGWTGSLWKALPKAFFDLLAAVWNAVLDGAPLPAAWVQVRVCLIPKDDGGLRPLAIAALAWRLGATCLVRQLTGWVHEVFPAELFGGMPHRGIDDVHAALSNALFLQRGGGPLAGCKADVKKCFDSADPKLAVQCMRRLGAPENVLTVIERFYQLHERWLMVEGACARHPVVEAAALLQGCPFSPLCLNSMMTVWLAAVKKADTGCTLSVFLDDRAIWVRKRRGAARAVRAAMVAGREADQALGFELHPAKLESFGTSQPVREDLLAAADEVGIPQQTFRLLGLPYNTTAASPIAAGTVGKVLKARCKRIQLCGQSRSLRCALLRLLVVPLFRWAAPWLRQYKKDVQAWTGAIERAAWGGSIPRGRSPALAWAAVLGLELYPAFVNAETAVLREHRRLQLGRHPREAPQTKAALRYFGWTRDDAGVWHTRHGSFQAGDVGAPALRRLMRQDGARKLFLQDNKAKQAGGFDGDFDLNYQVKTRDVAQTYPLRVMVGAASDARSLTPKDGNVQDLVCTCGFAGPTRTHLTFDCPRATWSAARRTLLERRFLAALRRPLPPRRPLADYSVQVGEVAEYLSELDSDLFHYVATDGGCLLARKAEGFQQASWAVAFADKSFGGLVEGPDQTAAEGERVAVFILAEALLLHGRWLRLLVDNQAVAGRLLGGEAACENGDPWRPWKRVAKAVRWLQVAWVPAHNKQASWTPPSGWIDADACRALNRRADAAAGSALQPCSQAVAHAARAADERFEGARDAVAAQRAATQDWHDRFVNMIRYGGAQKVHFLPLWLAPWLLSTILANALVATCWSFLTVRVPEEALGSIHSFCTWMLPSASAALVTDAVWAVFGVLAGTTLGMLASIPWTIACKAKLQSHALMLEQMACFDCRAAQCTIEADRVLVQRQVQALFRWRSEEDSEPVVQTTSSSRNAGTSTASRADPQTVWIRRDIVTWTQSDQEALDGFNSYIRGPLRCSVMESVGSELHVPYRICLVATLPMIFYSPVDILQCDDDCRSHHGLPSLERGFLSEILSWIVVGLLVFPTFYPIFLRMLKQAFSAQSQTLQLVLAALGAIATFVYGYLCSGMVYGLTENIFQPRLTGIMLYILMLILLLLQLRCLFGTDGAVARVSVDGTYRALHAADTFSI
ncbi:unnamed protein product [Symbiodinium sp. CCMP2592]|nr:unnamed protein product [Symbiodinium sp. CCMP2592]